MASLRAELVLRSTLKYGFIAILGVILVAPTAVVFVISFSSATILFFPPPHYGLRWYRHFFDTPIWTSSAVASLEVALLVMVLATVLGTATALGIERGRFPGRGLISALLLSPLIVPVVVVALGMYIVSLHVHLVGTLLVFVLAHTTLGLPFVIINVAANLRTMDRTVELAAASCGAGPLRTFFQITLAQIWPGVVAGALFAFITSWDEAVVAFFLSSPLLQTLPVVIWQQVRQDVDPTVAAAASLVTAVSLLLLSALLVVQMRGARLRAAQPTEATR